MKHQQQGAALIVVLMILVMVTAIGVYAIRQSLTNLQVSTGMQLQKLLMQNSDSALLALQKDFQLKQDSNFANTPIGQVVRDGAQGQELEFCYKPGTNDPSSFFTLSDFRMIVNNGTTTGVNLQQGNVNKGYCDPGSMFNSIRQVMVTQMTVVLPDDPAPDIKKYGLAALGNDLKNVDIDTKRIRVVVTTLAPGMATGGVSTDDIKTCLKDRVGDVMALANKSAETKSACLGKLGVPYNTQVTDFVLRLNQQSSRLP